MKVIMPIWSIDESFIHLTKEAVDSLRGTELVVVDNGSTHGQGYLRSIADLYIRNEENLGYAKAVNQGLDVVTDKYVAIANNDVRLSPNWLDVTNQILDEFDDVGSVHYRMIPYEDPFLGGEDIWVGGKERWCSASFFVTKNCQKYDENFRNGGEDWDYWHRLRQKDLKQVYTNIAEYQHMDSYTRNRNPQRDEDDRFNEEYYKEKWGSYPEEHLASQFPDQFAIPWRPFP